MKRILATALCILLVTLTAISGTAQGEDISMLLTTATDNNYTITEDNVTPHGRTYFNVRGINFNWSMSGFSFSFKGTGASVQIRSRSGVRFAVYLDGNTQPEKEISVKTLKSTYTLAENLENAEHTITIKKLTEADWGGVAAADTITVFSGELLPPPETSSRTIEFIGDSVTAAYGVLISDGSIDNYRIEDQDASKSYSSLTAMSLGCEFSLVAKSGIGFFCNSGGGLENTMKDAYEYTDYFCLDKTTKWDFSGHKSDIVVIALGDNDTNSQDSAAHLEGARYFLSLVRKNNPESIIIWAYGMCTTWYDNNIKQAVKEANDAGDKNVYYFAFDIMNPSEDGAGAAGHPSYTTQKKNADKLTAFITDLTGWQKGSEPGDDTSALTLKNDSSLTLENGILSNIAPNTKVSDADFFTDDNKVVFLSPDGETLNDSDILYTGCTTARMFGARVLDKCELSVRGDIDGDGKVNANDALLALQSAVGKIKLAGAKVLAASLSGNSNVTATDALKILQFSVGKTATI